MQQLEKARVQQRRPGTAIIRGFPGDISGEDPPANAEDLRDTGLIPGSGRSPGGGHGNPHSSSLA